MSQRSGPSEEGTYRSDVAHEEAAVLAEDAWRHLIGRLLLEVMMHTGTTAESLLRAGVHHVVHLVRRWTVHGIRLIVVEAEVINDCLADAELLLLVLERLLGHRAALVLAAAARCVHVVAAAVELLVRRSRLQERPVLGRVLNGRSTEFWRVCSRLLRTDRSEILCQSLRLRR